MSPLIGKKVKHKHTAWGDGTVMAVEMDPGYRKFRLLVLNQKGDLTPVWAEDVTVLP